LGVAERVRLVGSVSDVDLHRWLRTARVFVSMSEREAFGMAPVEAACAGARIILSDIPAHREIADDFLRRCVTVMTDRSPSALAAEIGRQLVAPWSQGCTAPDWRDVVEETVRVYRTSGVELPVLRGIGQQVGSRSLQYEGLGI
jgi:glycosyltransferase involved in cell wall biosynthesis